MAIHYIGDLEEFLANAAQEVRAARESIAREDSERGSTITKKSLKDKLITVVDNTLDSLIEGDIALENAQELQALIAAISSLDSVNPHV